MYHVRDTRCVHLYKREKSANCFEGQKTLFMLKLILNKHARKTGNLGKDAI